MTQCMECRGSGIAERDPSGGYELDCPVCNGLESMPDDWPMPWDTFLAGQEYQGDHAFDHFGAWKAWMSEHCTSMEAIDGGTGRYGIEYDCVPVLDLIDDSCIEANLYNIMARIAAGEFGPLSVLKNEDRAVLARCLADKNGREMIRVALDPWRDDA